MFITFHVEHWADGTSKRLGEIMLKVNVKMALRTRTYVLYPHIH